MKCRVHMLLRRFDRNTIRGCILLICWFAGLSLGLLAADFCGDALSSFVEPLPSVLPVLGGALITAYFPLLFSACAVVLFSAFGCLVAAALRGLAQGFFLGILAGASGAASPILAFLLVFTGLMMNPVLLFFWYRRMILGAERFWDDLLGCAGIAGLILITDYWVIAPFLVDVINL